VTLILTRSDADAFSVSICLSVALERCLSDGITVTSTVSTENDLTTWRTYSAYMSISTCVNSLIQLTTTILACHSNWWQCTPTVTRRTLYTWLYNGTM